MSAKDYRAFAERIATMPPGKTQLETAKVVAEVCKADNGKFDVERFYRACKLTDRQLAALGY
jgi:hypothetical protein